MGGDMFTFSTFAPSFLRDDAIIFAAVAVPLLITLLLLRRAFKPSLSSISHEKCDISSGSEDPAPLYLASSTDDEKLIGGNPIYLVSPPRGPMGTTLTFRVFTPPSFEKEIPKIDIYGAIQFVRTGTVRTFVPTGSKRLLVINFQQMTLAVYVPKTVKKKKVNKKLQKNKKEEDSTTDGGSLFSNESNSITQPSVPKRRLSTPGINISHISTRRILIDEQEQSVDVDESEKAWDPRNFKSDPALLVGLDELVSITAIPPRHGGVIEISSRVETCNKNVSSKNGGDPGGSERKKKVKNATKSSRPTGDKRASSPMKQSLQRTELNKLQTNIAGHSRRESEGDDCTSECVSTALDETDNKKSGKDKKSGKAVDDTSVQDRQDEFVFSTPRDASEFQRIILALRTVGREISYLYETLEVIQSSPKDPLEDENETSHTFVPPGVALDDAWRSLNEIPILRKGLSRYKEGYDGINVPILEESEHDGADLMGLVDFFSLFLPPLPTNSLAIPSTTPCAKTDSMFEGNPDLMPTSGIECHYQRLCFISALQRLVSRAALYVRVYAWTRIITNDGFSLPKPHVDEGDAGVADTNGHKSDDDVSNGDKSQNANDDTKVEGESSDGCVDGTESEPATVSNPTSLSPSQDDFDDHQGYSCVGWCAFHLESINEETRKSNPLEFIPGIREVVKKYPYAHFVLVSHFGEKLNKAFYFLFVRSLPVGVDRKFDDTLHNFVCSSANARDNLLGISMQIGPSNDSSLLTTIGCKVLGIKVTRTAQTSQCRTLSLRHFGGSLKGTDDLLNYVAISSQFSLTNIPFIGRGLLWIVRRVCLQGTNIVDMSFELRAFSNDMMPERVISSIKMTNTDLRICIQGNNLNATHDIFNTCHDNDQIDELHRDNIDAVLELLAGQTVPVRKRNRIRGEHYEGNRGETIMIEEICNLVSRSDVKRYLIACKCDLKATVTRLVESSAWRGIMFPVDTRLCQIEMRAGQFFQQGCDKEKNPIFYFRNILMGPWRDDVQSTMLSVLHKLETFFAQLDHQKSDVKVTMIIFMGVGREESESLCSDPRIDPYEEFEPHSNVVIMHLLNDLIPRHYPERVAKTLVVSSKGWKKSRLRSYFPQATVLSSLDDLKKHVSAEELVTFAGGNAKVSSDAFHSTGSFGRVGA